MFTIVGVGAMIVAWAMLVAWVAKLAQARGRFIAGWALAAVAAGIAGCCVGLAVTSAVLESETSSGLSMLVLFAPLVGLIAPMTAIGFALHRTPVKVAQRNDWPVHFLDRGPGRLTIDAGIVRFAWPEGSRATPLDQLRSVEADGECVRISCTVDGEELALVVLPMAKPETPAARKQQSQMLARQLHAPPPVATAAYRERRRAD
jgi:hypothetical protein